MFHYLPIFFNASSLLAGINAPFGGVFLLLNSSDICSKVIHSTPSCLLICSVSLVSR